MEIAELYCALAFSLSAERYRNQVLAYRLISQVKLRADR